MFDNVSRATELANEIREMWGRWQQQGVLRDGYRRNFDHRGGMAYQRNMDELQERIKEHLVQWQAETGRQWRPDYYYLPPSDEVMEKAFAALADELEAQDAELLEGLNHLMAAAAVVSEMADERFYDDWGPYFRVVPYVMSELRHGLKIVGYEP